MKHIQARYDTLIKLLVREEDRYAMARLYWNGDAVKHGNTKAARKTMIQAINTINTYKKELVSLERKYPTIKLSLWW